MLARLSFTPLYDGESSLLEMTTLIGVVPGAVDLESGLAIQVDGLFEGRPA